MGRKKHMLATSENRAHSIEKRLPNFLPRADAKSLRLEQTMEEESPFRLVDFPWSSCTACFSHQLGSVAKVLQKFQLLEWLSVWAFSSRTTLYLHRYSEGKTEFKLVGSKSF